MIRPSKLAAASLASALLLLLTPASEAKRTVAQKKQIARTQFEEAERLREELNGKPERFRSKRDYQRVMDAYRKVYYVAPTSNRADASALAVADLLVDFGRRFDDEKSFRDAISQYEFLRREYPGSRYRIEALFTIAQVLREDLDDQEKAKATFEDVARKYPGTDLAQQAKDALAEMAREEKEAKAAAKQPKKKKDEQTARQSKSSPKDLQQDLETINQAAGQASGQSAGQAAAPQSATLKRAKLPLVTSIRQWATPDYTRVAIDLEDEVKYEAGRVSGPDRIFFDLHDAKLAPELVGKSFEVNGDGLLKKVRVAQFSLTMTRVVLEVDSLAEYSAFLLPNPYRLIIDIHGKQQIPTSVAKSDEQAKPNVGVRTDIGGAKKEPTYISSGQPAPPAKTEDPTKELAESNAPITRELAKNNPADVRATTAPTSAPTVEVVAPRTAKKTTKKGKDKETESASALPPPKEADPLAGGDRSLIRALGLKIGRIVVDAGHGGHDTGTIGPHGLQEKDLVLDVATRLGKLLEQKLGAEVVYTRDDDTFIPLETRTAIANKHEADLFISVHANSSRDPKARGVETYYLNFTSDSDALEVAARENAVSEKSVFELSDLVKKIAMKEKIEESREFAADVQGALFTGLSLKTAGLRNRGVKKAPFVVLIGANMPSILAEISFVSNPQDERRLKTPEYRQKIAESLFKGVSKYANGLSGVKTAAKLRADAANAGSSGQ
jgi:N-acetylmuramoyl-L-alanine amidase